jgi:hypothetical protein
MQKHYATRKHKHQKMYKMRGCSKACTRNHRHKRGHLGGTNTTVIAAPQKALGADFSLAYPYNGPVVPNPALAYSGKGGYKSQNGIFPEPSNLAITRTSNVNGANMMPKRNSNPRDDGVAPSVVLQGRNSVASINSGYNDQRS